MQSESELPNHAKERVSDNKKFQEPMNQAINERRKG